MKSKLYSSLTALIIALVMIPNSFAERSQECDSCDEFEDCKECCTANSEVVDGRCCKEVCRPLWCDPCNALEENICHSWDRKEYILHRKTDREFIVDDTFITIPIGFGSCRNVFAGHAIFTETYSELKLNVFFYVDPKSAPMNFYSVPGVHGYLSSKILKSKIKPLHYTSTLNIPNLYKFVTTITSQKLIDILSLFLTDEISKRKDKYVQGDKYIFNEGIHLNHLEFKPIDCEEVHGTAKPVWSYYSDVFGTTYVRSKTILFYCDSGPKFSHDLSPKIESEFNKANIGWIDDLTREHAHTGFTKLKYCYQAACEK